MALTFELDPNDLDFRNGDLSNLVTSTYNLALILVILTLTLGHLIDKTGMTWLLVFCLELWSVNLAFNPRDWQMAKIKVDWHVKSCVGRSSDNVVRAATLPQTNTQTDKHSQRTGADNITFSANVGCKC